MTAGPPLEALEALRARAGSGRVVLGIVGPPGSGKSTLAREVACALWHMEPRAEAVHVPQDGFHFRNAELDSSGLRGVKGRPETFDAAGYADLLRGLRERPDADATAPDYDRELHEPVEGRIAVPATARVIVAEGNYLALDEGDWPRVREQIDVLWRLEVPWPVARERLVRRHMQGGRDKPDASAWADRVDRATTRIVESTNGADLLLRWGHGRWEIAG